jgi:hypothetical protein
MSKILIALSFALFAPACMTAPSHDGRDEAPQTSVEASSLAADPRADAACLQACEEAFETCVAGAADSFEECECGNDQVACDRRCGKFAAFHPCF